MEYYKNKTAGISSWGWIRKIPQLSIIMLSVCAFIPASVDAATSISQYGITWNFNANYTTGQFVNGDYWVVGPVTITSISPATTTSGRIMNGSMLNPKMANTQGYDSSITYSSYDATLNVARTMPLTIQPGNSLVSTISLASPFPGGAKYALKTAAVLTVMASAPPAGTFRPSYYYGADKTAKYNWSTVQANMGLLKNLDPKMDLTAQSVGQYYTWPGNIPAFIPKIQRVWLDHRVDWANEYLAPQDNMPDYGSIIADELGWASLLLQSQLPAGWTKDELLKHFIQKGIDWSGAIQHQAAGSNGWDPDGGHSLGRKWPTMFAAIMLSDTTLLNYIKTKSGDYCKAPYSTGNGFSTNVSTPSDAVSFPEDGQTFIVSSIDISKNRSGAGLVSYLSSDLNLPEYGMYHSSWPETDDRSWTSNHRQVNSGTVYSAFALAALFMGQRANWNHDAFFDYTDRFSEVSLAVSPSNSYPWKGHETAIALNMWKAYRKTYTPYWTRSNPTAVPIPDMTSLSDPAYLNGSRVGSPPSSTNYTITASVSGANGTISPSGSVSVTSGSSASFTATPASGYTVDLWKLDGTTVQTGGSNYSLSNVTAAHTVTVQFKVLSSSTGPVGYWKFDETSGTTAADSSGNNNSGTLLNSANFVTTGKIGGAVELVNAVNDAVQIGTNNLNAASGTICMWVYPESFSIAPQYLFGHTNSPWANRIQLYIGDTAGTLGVGLGDTHSTNTSIQTLALQTWQHIALTWNGSSYVVYVNGVSKATGTYTGLTALNSFAQIGNDGYDLGTDEAFSGRIDETRIYNRALSATEVQAIYAVGSSGTITYTVNASVSGGNGTITPSGSVAVTSGSSQMFTAVPASGYTVNTWILDGITVQTGGNSYTLSNITAAHNVTVSFKAQSTTTYTITASVSGANGTLSPSGSFVVNSGSNQQFTAAPASGYTVDTWKLDGTTAQTGGTIYTLNNITANHAVTVQFKLGTAADPVGYWKFDDASGTTATDSSGNSNDATLLSNASFVSTGKFGGAVDLVSANTDAVQISTANCSPAAGTISLWVYPTSFSTTAQYIFGHATSPWANRIQLYIADSAGNLGLGMGDSHSTQTSIKALTAQTWSHIALTWNGSNYVVYVNGVAEATGTYTGLSSLNTVAHIGNDGYSAATNEAFLGRVDETRLYNRALSASEIQTLYSGGGTTNNAPVFSPVPNQTVIAGAPCQFAVSATDADGDAITYSASNLPAGAAFNASTRVFSWTPLATQVGTYNVTLAASDGKSTTLMNIGINVYAQSGNTNDTLVLDMTFNDTPTDGINDCSPSNNNGTSPSSGMPTLTPGKFYNGYSFDGLADCVIIPGSPSLDCNIITLAAWVNPNAYVARQRVVCKEIGTGAPSTIYALRFMESDPTKIEFWFTVGNVEYTLESKTSIPLNQWTHIAATYDGSTATVYVNGKADNTTSGISGKIISNGSPVYIGGSQFASQDFFHGMIDEVLIYDDALSASEIPNLLLPADAPPILATIGNKNVNENQNLSFVVSATDPDGNSIIYSASNLPSGATFNAATRTFSWTPSYSQSGTYSVTFIASDGTLDDEKTISINVGDVTTTGFRDDFSATTLNTSVWTFTNPLGDATQSLSNGVLRFAFPASKLHDILANGNTVPRIMTPISNTDFTIETKFISNPQKNQIQGLLVQQDSQNMLRFEIWSDGVSSRWYFENWVNGSISQTLDKSISFNAPYFLRIVRTGTTWRFYYSADGTTWTTAASITRTMSSSSAGVYAGNCGTIFATYTTLVDYFSKK